MKNRFLILTATVLGFASMTACTDLEPDLEGNQIARDAAIELLSEGVDASSLLAGAENGFDFPIMDQTGLFSPAQHTTDETIGPTRGPDWDDNGIWRVLHDHTWNAEHSWLSNTFKSLNDIHFATLNTLAFDPDPQTEAQARFMRAYVMFTLADNWNQVQVRENLEDLSVLPEVLVGQDAVDLVISQLETIIPDLPNTGNAATLNADAARVLLMKAYLNRGTIADRTNPTFPQADMDKVIALADQIAANGYSLNPNYFQNFARDNQTSPENIWTFGNEGAVQGGNIQSRYYCTLHYNQNPGGWNGFTTLGSFYDSFEDDDERRGSDYPGVTDVSGLTVGLLFGQQFDKDGNPLQDRKGNPLSFTKDVSLIETGDDLEITGIRVVKYPPDYQTEGPIENDAVVYRFADVLLMKAEALLRNGDEPAARAIVQDLQTARGVSNTVSTLTLDELLAERGRELYWENHRRQDLIRFGKYLDAYENKPVSGPERLIFPIPLNALAINPNLTQNPGY